MVGRKPVATGQRTLQSLVSTEEKDMTLAHLKLLPVLAATAVIATTAQADTTYYYTGSPFTVGSGSITAVVTFDPTVTATYTGLVFLNDIVSWSIASGASSFAGTVQEPDTTNYIPLRFQFSSGLIVNWDFAYKSSTSLPDPYIIYSLRNSAIVGPGATADESPTGYVVNNPGVWAPVPEASALSLLLLGISILGLLGKTRAARFAG